MPSQVCLALLELNGVGFSVEECERQKHVMQAKLTALESQAYDLAGHSFSLTSVDDIAQVSTQHNCCLSTICQLPPKHCKTYIPTCCTVGAVFRAPPASKRRCRWIEK